MSTTKLEDKTVATEEVTWLKALTNRVGPAGIIGMTIAGPGTISALLVGGYGWSYSMLWTVICSCLFAVLGMYMTTLVTGTTTKDSVEYVGEYIGRPFVWLCAIVLFCIQFAVLMAEGNALAQVGGYIFNNTQGGILPFDIPVWILAVILTVCVILVYFYRANFSFISNVAWALLTFMVVCFAATMFISKPDLGQVIKGFIPNFPPVFPGKLPAEQAATAIGGVLGGSFGLYTFIYHPFALKEKGWARPDKISYAFWDGFWASGVIYGLFGISIFITFATLLYPLSAMPAGIGGAAVALQPLLGPFAYATFILGWFAAVFTTTAGAAMIGFTPIFRCFGLEPYMRNPQFRKGLIIYTFIPAALIGPALGKNAFTFLTWAMSLSTFTAPVGVAAWLYLGNKKDIMGNSKFKPIINILAGIAFCVTLWVAILMIKGMIK